MSSRATKMVSSVSLSRTCVKVHSAPCWFIIKPIIVIYMTGLPPGGKLRN